MEIYLLTNTQRSMNTKKEKKSKILNNFQRYKSEFRFKQMLVVYLMFDLKGLKCHLPILHYY